MAAVAEGNAPAEAKVKPETTFRALVNLWPYMWPSDRPDLKRRVVVALAILVAAKVVTVLIPYTYKWATDALVHPPTGPTAALTVGVGGALFVPIMLIVAYGVGRILMNVFNNLRDALFAKVGQHAVRQLAYKTFVHMHELSLRYHLQRRTGGLSRVIERGVTGIETIVRFTILNTIPTFLEFLLAAAVIAWQFDWTYLARHRRDGRRLCLVHGEGVGLAHQDPPDDERVRPGRAFQGDQLAPQFRDGQIFRQREDGGVPLRPRHGALRAGGDPHLDVDRLAQYRPGGDLHHRHDHRAWRCRAQRCCAASRRSAISC